MIDKVQDTLLRKTQDFSHQKNQNKNLLLQEGDKELDKYEEIKEVDNNLINSKPNIDDKETKIKNMLYSNIEN